MKKSIYSAVNAQATVIKRIKPRIFAMTYFGYFIYLGIFVAFFPVLLQEYGYNQEAIGAISAVFFMTRVVAPSFWGAWADKKRLHVPLLRIKTLLSLCALAVVFLCLSFYPSYPILLLAIGVFGLLWSGTLPIYEATNLAYINGDNHQYNRVRLWGSIGFIVAVLGMGQVLDVVQSGMWALNVLFRDVATANTLAVSMLLGLLFLCYCFWRLPLIYFEPSQQNQHDSILRFFNNRLILSFLGIAFLMHMSHGVFYAFFSVYMESLGYTHRVIGFFWVVGVIAEIFVFLLMQRWLASWSAYAILLICLVVAVIRWLLLGFYADNWLVVIAAQLFHALTFAAFHSLTMRFIHGSFASDYQARAQSFFTAVCYGLGSAIGTYYGGWLMQEHGAKIAFISSAIQVAVALFVAIFVLPRTGEQAFR